MFIVKGDGRTSFLGRAFSWYRWPGLTVPTRTSRQAKGLAIDTDAFVGRWVMLFYDLPPPPWHDAMPLGTGFEIFKNGYGVYWLPNPSLKTPMNQTRKLEINTQGRGEFPAGESLIGSLHADFGGTVGVISFTLNAICQHRRIISLCHGPAGSAVALTHGRSHGVDV